MPRDRCYCYHSTDLLGAMEISLFYEILYYIIVGTLPKGYTRGAPLPKVPSYRAQKQPLWKKQVHLPRTPISRIGARLAAAQCALRPLT